MMFSACGGPGDVGAVASDEPAVAQATNDPTTAATDQPDPTTPTPDDQPAPATLGTCDGANAPARCTADPSTFAGYGAAGVISFLELLDDTSCCADFTGDGEPDNALGEGFAAIGKLDQLNTQLRESLVTGTQTILLELVGVDDAQNDDEIELHVYGGRRVASTTADNPAVELDPATIDQGVAPLFTFDHASIVDGRLVASHGEMELEASFNGVLLKPTVHDVQVSARIEDLSATGLTLRDGEFGGRVELQRIYDEINAVASGCDCLGLDAPLVTSINGEIGECAAPDVSACQSEGRETCAALVEVCPVMDIIASNIADVDSDGDGTLDSISLGALFEADAARITGVMR